MITEIEDYFTSGCGRCPRFATEECSTRPWIEGLLELRRICLAAGLAEAVKWGHPCYGHAGRNIAIIGAFRADFRISFFDAALLSDPRNLLEKQGPNTRHANAIRFADTDGVFRMEAALHGWLSEAKGHAEAGRRPPKDDTDLPMPKELAEALQADPDLAAAYHALTPGRQKSHLLAFNATKSPATRTARILKARDKILAGKGATER